MTNFWYVAKQSHDFEGYMVGSQTDKVGPFLSKAEAETWIAENPAYKAGVYNRQEVVINDMSKTMMPPEKWAYNRGIA